MALLSVIGLSQNYDRAIVGNIKDTRNLHRAMLTGSGM